MPCEFYLPLNIIYAQKNGTAIYSFAATPHKFKTASQVVRYRLGVLFTMSACNPFDVIACGTQQTCRLSHCFSELR